MSDAIEGEYPDSTRRRSSPKFYATVIVL